MKKKIRPQRYLRAFISELEHRVEWKGVELTWQVRKAARREARVLPPPLPLHPYQLIFPVGYKTVFPQNGAQ